MARKIKLTPFGKEVEKALIDRDMSKSDLSKELGITQAYLTDILKGTRVGTEKKKHIAAYLKLDVVLSSN